MPWSPLALADLHLDLLYERDDAGLLIRPRNTAITAPSFHLVRTTEGNRWVLSAALSQHERTGLQQALSREPVVDTIEAMEGRPPVLGGIRSPNANGSATAEQSRGPAFRFPDPLPLTSVPAELLPDPRGTRAVPELSWIRDATPAEQPLSVARNSSGEVVSVCHSARATVRAAEAGVETALDYRGLGLAGAVVLVWATAVLEGGRLPLYSTQWANDASRAVARKVGLIPYGEDSRST